MNKSNTNTLLVNKNNKIKDYYLKKVHLLETYDIDGKKILVEENTLNSYLLLKEFLMNKNIEIGISSAYRSIDDQEKIYNDFVEKYGEEYTKTHVAVPYTSEHHTGLCLDINIKVNGRFPKDNYELEEQKEYYESIYKYLKDFGFIFIGSQKNDYCKKLISLNEKLKGKKENHNVEILYGVPREKISEYTKNAYACVISSNYEYYPITIVESLAAGNPFISTDVGIVRFLPGGVIANTQQEISYWMEFLGQNQEYATELGEAGRNYAIKNLRIETKVKALEDIIQGE